MANSREALSQRDIIEAITAYAWEVGIAAGYDLKVGAVSEVGSGKPHDPEKQRLAEIIDRLNDLCGAEVGDDDKLHFANGIADRNERDERDEAMMAQVGSHSEDLVTHGLLPKKVTTPCSTPSATTRNSACRCWRIRKRVGSLRC